MFMAVKARIPSMMTDQREAAGDAGIVPELTLLFP